MKAEKVSKAEVLAVLGRLVEDAEAFSDGLSCVGCGGELERDEFSNEEEVVHEDDCTIVKAKALIRRLEKELLT